jgi:uncharacterized membrane protein YidH (DUF202 family)
MSAADCLGLCLAWTRTTGPLFLLQVAFAIEKYNWIIKSGQNPTEQQNHGVNYDVATLINIQATLMRQSAEWGMRSLQSSFS